MSGKFTAEIWIGGNLKADLVLELCDMICGQGVSFDWGAEPSCPQTTEELLKAVKERDGVPLLYLCDQEAAWGELDDLEKWLREHGLPYTRVTGSSDCYDGVVDEYRPGRDLVSLSANSSGTPVAHVEPVQKAWYLLKEAQHALAAGTDAMKLVVKAADLLASELPPELPRLDPFQIIA